MSKLPEIVLRRGEQDRIVAGHPWIYQSSIQKLETPAADGDVVLVKDFRGKAIGIGFYNSKSRISVRDRKSVV